MSEYKLKPGKIGQKVINLYKQTEEKFTDAFLEEDGSLKTGDVGRKVTGAYQKIEDTVVDGYKKVEDAFVDRFLEKTDDQPKTDENK